MVHLRTKSLALVSSLLGLLAVTGCAASTEEGDDVEVAAPESDTVTTANGGKGKGKGVVESAEIEEPNNHLPIPPVPLPIPRGPQK